MASDVMVLGPVARLAPAGPTRAPLANAPIVLVSERASSFLSQYIRRFSSALSAADVPIALVSGEECDGFGVSGLRVISSPAFRSLAPSLDEHRYLEALRVAREVGGSHVHLCFLHDPQRLFLALVTDGARDLAVTYSMFGLAQYLRSPIYREFHERLLAMDAVRGVLVHSNAPAVAAETAARHGILQSSKVRFVHDPIYDNLDPFRMDRDVARRALGLRSDTVVALYFGTFSHKKGPDLLLAAAKRVCAKQNICFLFAGMEATATSALRPESWPVEGVRWDNRFIDDASVPSYFAACDLVVLPYRRDYLHDTSGVFVQAGVARRPVLVPELSPFDHIVKEYEVGQTFRCEDVEDLARRLSEFAQNPSAREPVGWGRYLAGIESWSDLAGYVTSAVDR